MSLQSDPTIHKNRSYKLPSDAYPWQTRLVPANFVHSILSNIIKSDELQTEYVDNEVYRYLGFVASAFICNLFNVSSRNVDLKAKINQENVKLVDHAKASNDNKNDINDNEINKPTVTTIDILYCLHQMLDREGLEYVLKLMTSND
ncbi:hypothetical protein GJ496_010343 [Pomphorhynchus laevis]|nr:hypothetical protein GJ496_010343 [Pomphorhynchus laevis]